MEIHVTVPKRGKTPTTGCESDQGKRRKAQDTIAFDLISLQRIKRKSERQMLSILDGKPQI